MASNRATKNLPGAVAIGNMGGLVRLDNETRPQGRIVPDATPKNSGVMTKTQAAQLATLVAGGGGSGGGFIVVPANANIVAAFGQLIDGNPTGASFNVTLPQASSAVGANAIIVKNESRSPNHIAVVVHAGDTLDGGASRNLTAGETVYLVSDGGSNWIIVSDATPSVDLYINVAEYGAVGDYDDVTNTGTNNAAAFDAAFLAAISLAAAGGIATVYVPPGSFAIKTDTAIVDGTINYFGIRFLGNGPASRIVFPAGGAALNGFQFRNLDVLQVENLTFTGRNVSAQLTDCLAAIHADTIFEVKVRNCNFNGLLCDRAVLDFFGSGSLVEDCRFNNCGLDAVHGLGLITHSQTVRGVVLRNIFDTSPPGGANFASKVFNAGPIIIYYGDSVDDQAMYVAENAAQYGVAGVVFNPSVANLRYYHIKVYNNGFAIVHNQYQGVVVVKGIGAHTVELEQNSIFLQFPNIVYSFDNVDHLNVRNQLKNDPQRVQPGCTAVYVLGSGVAVANFEAVEYDSINVDPVATRLKITNNGVTARVRVGDASVNASDVLVKSSATPQHVSILGAADATALVTGLALEPTQASTGSVQCPANNVGLADGTLWTVTDGVNTVTFEFIKDGRAPQPGNTKVALAGAVTAADVAAALITAWNTTLLTITPANAGAGLVTFTFNTIGEQGNQFFFSPIPNSGFLVDGMFNGRVNIRVAELQGQQSTFKSDGTAVISPGDALTSSTATAGRVKTTVAGGATIAARAIGAAAAAADALVEALLSKEMLPSGGGALSGIVAAQTEAVAAGAGSPTTSSNVFSDIGDNGATTGFADWNVNPGAGTYTIWFSLKGFYSTAACQAEFQILVDGVAVPAQPLFRMPCNATAYADMVGMVNVTLAAGAHTFRLQWRSANSANLNVDGGYSARAFALLQG